MDHIYWYSLEPTTQKKKKIEFLLFVREVFFFFDLLVSWIVRITLNKLQIDSHHINVHDKFFIFVVVVVVAFHSFSFYDDPYCIQWFSFLYSTSLFFRNVLYACWVLPFSYSNTCLLLLFFFLFIVILYTYTYNSDIAHSCFVFSVLHFVWITFISSIHFSVQRVLMQPFLFVWFFRCCYSSSSSSSSSSIFLHFFRSSIVCNFIYKRFIDFLCYFSAKCKAKIQNYENFQSIVVAVVVISILCCIIALSAFKNCFLWKSGVRMTCLHVILKALNCI